MHGDLWIHGDLWMHGDLCMDGDQCKAIAITSKTSTDAMTCACHLLKTVLSSAKNEKA